MAQRDVLRDELAMPRFRLPLRSITKRLALWTPSILASILLALPLIGIMVWLLAWGLHFLHQWVLAWVLDPIIHHASLIDLWNYWNYFKNDSRAQFILIILAGTLAITLTIESYRVGVREALATNVRLTSFIANNIYRFFRFVAEAIWFVFGLLLSFFSREGFMKYISDRVEEIKEWIAEIK